MQCITSNPLRLIYFNWPLTAHSVLDSTFLAIDPCVRLGLRASLAHRHTGNGWLTQRCHGCRLMLLKTLQNEISQLSPKILLFPKIDYLASLSSAVDLEGTYVVCFTLNITDGRAFILVNGRIVAAYVQPTGCQLPKTILPSSKAGLVVDTSTCP